jgi:hypothetical protein
MVLRAALSPRLAAAKWGDLLFAVYLMMKCSEKRTLIGIAPLPRFMVDVADPAPWCRRFP